MRTLLWPSYSTWMGVSCTYMRMAVEEEMEAARDVGLPLSTSLARSSWTKVQGGKARIGRVGTLIEKYFCQLTVIERQAGRQPLCDRKGHRSFLRCSHLGPRHYSLSPLGDASFEGFSLLYVLESITRDPRCTQMMRSPRQSAKSLPNVLRLQPAVHLRRHSSTLHLATMGSGET